MEFMTYFTLEKRDSVYLLTMVNSGVANALDDDMLEEMHRHLDTIESDPAPHLALVIPAPIQNFSAMASISILSVAVVWIICLPALSHV